MGILVNSLELFEGGVRVDLGRLQALMPQQLADTFQSGAIVEHGCGEGVSEHVRRAFLHRGHLGQIVLGGGVDAVGRDTLAALFHEECSLCRAHLTVAHFDIVLQLLGHLLSEGHDALLVSLAGHFQLSGGEVHIAIVEPYQLCSSQSRLVEQYNNCTRAYIIKIVRPLLFVEQLVHLAFANELRQRLGFLRACQAVRRIAVDQFPGECEPVERAQCRKTSVDGGGDIASLHQALHPSSDDVGIHRCPVEPSL